VAPLRLGGLRGKQSTPSVGWEVPVSIQRLASESGEECGTRHGARDVFESGRKATIWLNWLSRRHFTFGKFDVIKADIVRLF
jgi:hypothetical protein